MALRRKALLLLSRGCRWAKEEGAAGAAGGMVAPATNRSC